MIRQYTLKILNMPYRVRRRLKPKIEELVEDYINLQLKNLSIFLSKEEEEKTNIQIGRLESSLRRMQLYEIKYGTMETIRHSSSHFSFIEFNQMLEKYPDHPKVKEFKLIDIALSDKNPIIKKNILEGMGYLNERDPLAGIYNTTVSISYGIGRFC